MQARPAPQPLQDIPAVALAARRPGASQLGAPTMSNSKQKPVFQCFTFTWRLLRTSEVLASRSCQAELPLDSPKPANSRLQTAKDVTWEDAAAGS